jgi:tRNA nucleotidyltransferase (CCA-adding enzyme)
MSIVLEQNGRLQIDDKNYLIPELQQMVGFKQKNPYHPEDDLMEHTQQVVELALLAQAEDTLLSIELIFAAIFHDIGKTECWQVSKADPEHRTFYGHDLKSKRMFIEIDAKYGLSAKHNFDLEKVAWLIGQHIRIMQFDQMRKFKQQELQEHPLFKELTVLRYCDEQGRKKK